MLLAGYSDCEDMCMFVLYVCAEESKFYHRVMNKKKVNEMNLLVKK